MIPEQFDMHINTEACHAAGFDYRSQGTSPECWGGHEGPLEDIGDANISSAQPGYGNLFHLRGADEVSVETRHDVR